MKLKPFNLEQKTSCFPNVDGNVRVVKFPGFIVDEILIILFYYMNVITLV